MHKYQGVTSSIDHRKMNNSLLDSSLRDASNGGIFISLTSIDGKLFAFFCLEIFDDSSSSIDASDMIRPPLDAPCYDDSNKLRFILLQSLDAEILRFIVLELGLPGYFWQVGVINVTLFI